MRTKPCAICHTDIPTKFKYCDPCRTKVRRERKMDWQNLYRKSHSKEYREYHRKWSCRNFALRNKPKREKPKSDWQLCQYYEQTYKDQPT